AAGSVYGVAWQANANGAMPTSTTSTPSRTIQATSRDPVSAAISSTSTANSNPLAGLPTAVSITWASWVKAPGEATPSPVSAVVRVLPPRISARHTGTAKFDATNPITSRGASSPTP